VNVHARRKPPRHLAWLALFVGWVGVPTLALAADAQTPPRGVLPDTARPLHYRLDLIIEPERERYSGNAQIAFELIRPARIVWLHGQELDVSRVTVVDAAGRVTPAKYEQRTSEGVAAVSVEEELPRGLYTLDVAYSAAFNHDIGGLFKVTEAGRHYAFTQLEPTDARRVFPGFDEPRFKTPFDVNVTARRGHRVITATPEIKQVEAGDGLVRTTFATSRPLPTYLVSFAVGDFDVVNWEPIPSTPLRDRPLPLRGIAAKGKGEKLRYALQNTASLLVPLEEYFGVAYPYEKLDLIAAPVYAGGMENAAALLYGEQYLLLDDDASPAQRRSYAYTHAHELAHSWIGNLVTPRWWDDLWSKESFATLLGNRAAAVREPAGQFDRDILRMGLHAMHADSHASTRSIQQPVATTDDIGDAYGVITYEKGNAVLAMLEGFVGEDAFRRSMQLHVQSHTDGTATTRDYLRSLQQASRSGQAASALESFLHQPGVPLLEMQWQCSGDRLTARLSQSRYVPLGSRLSARQRWRLPVCLSFGAGEKRQRHCLLMAEQRKTLSLPVDACPTAVMPNADALGYYRFALPAQQRAALVSELDQLSSREALMLAENLAAEMAAGRVSAAEYLSAAGRIAQHSAADVATAPIAALTVIARHLASPADAARARQYMRDIYHSQLARIGLATTSEGPAPEAADAALLRERVVPFIALELRGADLRRRLAPLGAAYIGYGTDQQLHPDAIDSSLIPTALAVAAQEHGRPFLDAMWRQLTLSTDFIFRRAAVSGFAQVRDPVLTQWVRERLWAPELRDNEALELFVEQASVASNLEDAWAWSRANLSKLAQRVPAFRRGKLLRIASGFCSSARRDEVAAALVSLAPQIDGNATPASDTLEQIELCAAMAQRQRESVAQFLEAQRLEVEARSAANARAALADFDAPAQPGCAVGVYRNGAIVHASGHGLADVQRAVPITAETVFNIASVSKQMTAFAIYMLESQRRLSLDDSVRKYVPELDSYAQPVTIAHLLHHTGGLRDYGAVLNLQGRGHAEPLSPQEILQIIVRQRAANHPPGVMFEYSNTGYALLALIVERISGQAFPEFAATQIFRPLGMLKTSIVSRYPSDIANLARGYAPIDSGFALDESLWSGNGSGQVHTTLTDLQRWDENLYSGNVGGPAVIRRMTEVGRLTSAARMTYAGGLVIGSHRGLATAGHNGSWAGYRSELLRFPDQHFSVAMLCNRADAETGPRVKRVAEAYLQSELDASIVPSYARALFNHPGIADPAQLPEGYYRDVDRGRYVRFWREQGAPKISTAGVEFKLSAQGQGVYASESLRGLYLIFVAGTAASAPRIVLSNQGDEPTSLRYLAQVPLRDAQRYVGHYRSAEAGIDYGLSVAGDALLLQSDREAWQLLPGPDQEFFDPRAGIAIRFERAHGPVRRLLFSTFLLRNLEFERVD
jgi:cytosol alanyl aminopeptidase